MERLVPAALLLGALSGLLTVVVGYRLIPLLARAGARKQIRAVLPADHRRAKAGTPTMGGLMIVVVVVPLALVAAGEGRRGLLPVLGVLLGCAVLGLLDDRLSLVGDARRAGMSARGKALWLGLIALAGGVGSAGQIALPSVTLPALGVVNFGLAAVPLGTLVVAATAHAVNLTDGLDTLAGGTTALAFAAYGLIALASGQAGLALFCALTVGALLGFLWHNAYPARVFLGDTGALALGGALGMVALQSGRWGLLPLIGGVFVVETLSVIGQVSFYRWTGGRRLLKMSPLHHHFELLGWPETRITRSFHLCGLLLAALGVALGCRYPP